VRTAAVVPQRVRSRRRARHRPHVRRQRHGHQVAECRVVVAAAVAAAVAGADGTAPSAFNDSPASTEYIRSPHMSMTLNLLTRLFAVTAMTGALALPTAALAQAAYPTAQAAADAFVDAIAINDRDALRKVVGADFKRYIPEEVASEDVTKFLAAWAKGRKIVENSPTVAHLAVGSHDGWVLPIPIVKSEGGWRFDPKAGAEEIRIRRIGRNELATIQALLAYHDAQKEYAAADRNGNGVIEYAQRITSTPGKHDGLIWLDDLAASPLGPVYGDETKNGIYHGYRFRALKAQGSAARGGARDYVVNGRMTRGFAAIAWPAVHGDTGVMTFIVNHDGVVFQKNLGPQSDTKARAITRFDPDSSWTKVDPSAK
jgi:hypothetical protein